MPFFVFDHKLSFQKKCKIYGSKLAKPNLRIRKTVEGFSATRRNLPETVTGDAGTRTEFSKAAQSGSRTGSVLSKPANGVSST